MAWVTHTSGYAKGLILVKSYPGPRTGSDTQYLHCCSVVGEGVFGSNHKSKERVISKKKGGVGEQGGCRRGQIS